MIFFFWRNVLWFFFEKIPKRRKCIVWATTDSHMIINSENQSSEMTRKAVRSPKQKGHLFVVRQRFWLIHVWLMFLKIKLINCYHHSKTKLTTNRQWRCDNFDAENVHFTDQSNDKLLSLIQCMNAHKYGMTKKYQWINYIWLCCWLKEKKKSL